MVTLGERLAFGFFGRDPRLIRLVGHYLTLHYPTPSSVLKIAGHVYSSSGYANEDIRAAESFSFSIGDEGATRGRVLQEIIQLGRSLRGTAPGQPVVVLFMPFYSVEMEGPAPSLLQVVAVRSEERGDFLLNSFIRWDEPRQTWAVSNLNDERIRPRDTGPAIADLNTLVMAYEGRS